MPQPSPPQLGIHLDMIYNASAKDFHVRCQGPTLLGASPLGGQNAKPTFSDMTFKSVP